MTRILTLLAFVIIAAVLEAIEPRCIACGARWAVFRYGRCRKHRVKRSGRGAFNPAPPRGRPNVPPPPPPSTPRHW